MNINNVGNLKISEVINGEFSINDKLTSYNEQASLEKTYTSSPMFDIYFSTSDTLTTWTINEIRCFLIQEGYCSIYYDGVIKKEDTRVESKHSSDANNVINIQYNRSKELANTSQSNKVYYVIVVYENKIR